MRLAIALLCSSSLALPAFASEQSHEPRVSVFDGFLNAFCVVGGVPDLSCCEANTLFVPDTLGIIEFSVQAELAGATAGGITSAEFYVNGLENLPAGWTCTVIPNLAGIYFGDLCRPGAANERSGGVVFPSCQVGNNGRVEIATIRVANFLAPAVDLPLTAAQIVATDPPRGGPMFDCPVLTLCDSPAFTRVCVLGTTFFINGGIRAPTNPSPPDAATGVHAVGTELSWDAPGAIRCHLGVEVVSVYFGTDPDPPLVSLMHTGTTFDPGPLEPFETYYWRVTRNDPGRIFVSSPVWSFTTHTTIGVERSTWAQVKGLFR